MNKDCVILEENLDSSYKPTNDEITQYADWLGFDLPKDNHLLHIAKEGLEAPLPKDWKPCKTKESGEIYYFNFVTGESTWDHPCDEHYREIFQKAKLKSVNLKTNDNVPKDSQISEKLPIKCPVKPKLRKASSVKLIPCT